MSISKARKDAGYTQMQVAKYLGITDSAVNQWESGKTKPRTSILVKLSELYGCPIEKLLKED